MTCSNGVIFVILIVGDDILGVPFFNAMSPLAPSERGLPLERVEEPAKQETVRLF